MRVCNVVGLLGVLASAAALADAPIASEADRAEGGERSLSALVGTAGFGLGASEAMTDLRFRALELYAALNDRTLDARYGESWTFLRRRAFSWTGHVSGSARFTLAGPFDAGLGPTGGLSFGWGGRRWDVFFGASLGAEYFVVATAVRAPVRLSVGARGRWGSLQLGLTARGGADLAPGLAPAGRADAVVTVGWGRGQGE